MTENKQQRPILIDGFSALFAAAHDFHAREMDGWNLRSRVPQTISSETSRHKTPRPGAQVLHRVIHAIHKAPVDITVDKGTPPDSEKPQQNQHFKYHRPVPSSHCAANTALIAKVEPNSPVPSPASPIITLVWNMHRSGAACSLNVTSIGICLSRQHVRIYRNRAFFAAECAAAVDSPGMRDYSETTFGMLAAHEPGVFPGTS
jgi:hypothetical protein